MSVSVVFSGEGAPAWWSIFGADARKHWAVAVNGTRRYQTRRVFPRLRVLTWLSLPVTLYRYVGPQGQLREQGEKVLAT